MHSRVPIVAVVGHKGSGKTTVMESVVRGLTQKGYRVATAKHINLKRFSMDTEGRDTWRHSTAGANPVVSVSDIETAIMIKKGYERFSLDELLKLMHEVDAIVLEGFSRWVLEDERVGKVLCINNRQEYKDYSERAKGEVIASCSFYAAGRNILRITEDSEVLVKQVQEFVERELQVLKILADLPRLDCKKCGFESCEELARSIRNGKADFSDCTPLKLKSKLKTKITVDDTEVPIQPFVSKIIRSSILGMTSSLKGVSITGDEKIHVKISS